MRCVDGAQLEQVSEFKYLGCVLDESGKEEAECHMKVASERKVAGAIRSLVNPKSLQLEFVRVLHEGLLVPVLLYGSETMIWREKERSRIRDVQMDTLRGLLDIMRMDRVLKARVRVIRSSSKMIGESVLCWFDHIERMANDRTSKRVYVGRCLVD